MPTVLLLLAFLLVSAVPAAAFAGSNIFYGHPRELATAESVYVWSTDPPALREAIIAQLAAEVPSLKIAENEESAHVVFVVRRRVSESADGEPLTVTSGIVIRSIASGRRLLMEPVSTLDDPTEAVREVTAEFIAELQHANSARFGIPPPRDYSKKPGPRFRTTAGLHPGMSKAEVRETIGKPTRLDGRAKVTQIWWYETTDGTTRVIFRGDGIQAVTFLEKK